jgi:PhzF family phenazine biosynthesis protein
MELPLYQIDAFTDRVLGGNPAAVCPLQAWLEDDLMQAIAAENNLSETAFFIRHGEDFELRWFTPTTEVDLFGHATLATAYLILTHLDPGRTDITFHTRSGALTVIRDGERLVMDFPAWKAETVALPDGMTAGLGAKPEAVMLANNRYMVLFPDESGVCAVQPNFSALRQVDPGRVIITAPGTDCDFVSRNFAPAFGIDEDPVTGSAHCALAPYWAERLGKARLHARQVSARGGELFCELRGEHVAITGQAVLYLSGTISV